MRSEVLQLIARVDSDAVYRLAVVGGTASCLGGIAIVLFGQSHGWFAVGAGLVSIVIGLATLRPGLFGGREGAHSAVGVTFWGVAGIFLLALGAQLWPWVWAKAFAIIAWALGATFLVLAGLSLESVARSGAASDRQASR
jgi:hypothetical protein